MNELKWETIGVPPAPWGTRSLFRTKVPGGWLVILFAEDQSGTGGGVTFIPDPNHEWDGGSPS